MQPSLSISLITSFRAVLELVAALYRQSYHSILYCRQNSGRKTKGLWFDSPKYFCHRGIAYLTKQTEMSTFQDKENSHTTSNHR